MEDQESKELLKENNKLLKKLVRSQRWSSITRAVYWIIIIAVTLGLYYYVQPYIDNARGLYDRIEDRIDFLGIGDVEE